MNKDSKDGSTAPHLSDSEIIDRFGGIRPMAAKLGIAVTTVQGWKARGHFPENRRQQIHDAARSAGIDLGDAGTPAPEAAAPPPATESDAAKPPAAESPATEPVSPSPAIGSGADAPGRPREAIRQDPPKPDRPEKKEPEPKADGAKATPGPATGPITGIGDARRLAPIALGLGLVLAVALFTRPFWEPAVYGSRADGAAADLSGVERMLDEITEESQTRDRALTGRIAALEAGGGEAGAALATQLATLEKNLVELERTLGSLDRGMQGVDDRLAALEAARGEVPESVTAGLRQAADDIEATRAALAALRAESAVRDERLTTLETRPVQTGERIAALALAVGQAETALNAGRPYRAALDRLVGIAPDDQLILDGVSALYARSDDGIPGRPALQRRFIELAPQIDRALADTGGDSWVDRAWHSLSTLVTVRRKDGAEASPVSRAETALADGDLAGVVDAFGSAGSLGAAGDAWLENIRARVAAENEIEALYGRVIAPLATTGEPAR